jgi:PAS domain S-box-containing protein
MAPRAQRLQAENQQLRRELAALRVRLEEAEAVIGSLREREAEAGRDLTERKQMEEALRESEQKLQRLFQLAPAPIALYEGPEHVCRFANAMYAQLVGHRAVLGLPLRTAVPELAGQGIVERFDRVYATGEPLVMSELRAVLDRRGDGVLAEGYLNVVVQPWFDAGGRVAGIMAVGFEVTEQVRAREAVQQSEARLRLALDAARMGTWTMDVRTGALSWDAAVYRVFDIGPDDAIDYARFLELVHPDDRAYVAQAMARAMDPGGDGRYVAEFRAVRRDGSVRWVLGTGEVVFAGRGAERTPVQMLGTAMDLTEHREIERALRESEERFRTLADNIAQLAWMADSRGDTFWYNERWYEYTGTTAEQVLGQGWRDVHHPEHVDRVVEKFQRCLASGEVWEDTFPLRGKDGSYRWFLSRAIPIRDRDGKVLRWFGTNTDITAQREVEEALKDASRRKDEFLAMLAHELRNPLAPIRTALEVMNLAGADEARARQMRDMIERQVTHMARLIDDLLDVSRIARGKVRLHVERCDLVAIVRNVADDYRPIFAAGGLALAVALPGEPLWLQGDATRLAQVVGNLLSNASKFTPPGGRVDMTVHAEGRAAVIEVRDTGMGIEPAMLEHVFEPFIQADLGLDRSKGGLGLGLALVRGLVALHGGTVEARSDGIGQGATFALRLPLGAPAAPAGQGPASDAVQPGRGLRILIIEDNRDAADSLQELLTLLGHEAAVAYAGPAALELAPRFRPDVVLCDIGLPGLDGFEVARALRQDPVTRGAYLVAQTGYGQDEDRRRTRAAGFDQHLRKPVALEDIQRILAAVAQR